MNSINIKKPCHEDWSSMSIVEQNRFCQSCKKIVVDFEAMSDEAIIDYLNKRKGQKTCGRFTNIQLDRINKKINAEKPKERALGSLIKPILAATLLAATGSTTALSQENNVKEINPVEVVETQEQKESEKTKETYTKIYGTVKSAETKELLHNIAIIMWLEDTIIGTSTDREGRFELFIPPQKMAPTSIHFETMYRTKDYKPLVVKLSSWQNHEMHVKLEKRIEPKIDEFFMGDINYIRTEGEIEEELPFFKRIWKKIKSIFTKEEHIS